MKTAVIIPAYNSESTLEAVIHDVKKELFYGVIIVVNDGSIDRTVEIAQASGAIVLSHCRNSGKGAALVTGFQKALSLAVDFIFTIDADGQHQPQHFQEFVKIQKETNADIVIGNRMHSLTTMPFHRILSNKTTSRLISLRIGCQVMDSQCGYRLIRANVLRKIRLVTNHFDLESEFIIKAGIADFRFAFVPIDTIYGKGTSAIHHVKDTLRFIRLYFSSFFWY